MAQQHGNDKDSDLSIAIVGGGIGGLCTAIGLLHKGIKCDVYEAAPAFAEIGAGVSLGPNAVQALAMIDPAAIRGFNNCATNNLWPSHQQHWFSFRKGQDHSSATGAHFYDLPCPTGQSSVHRARFLDELVALVPTSIAHFGKRLENAIEENELVKLTFSDGTAATHSALIGCDGVKSRVRSLVLGSSHPATTPTFSGKYAYRGLIPMPSAISLIGEELATNAQMYLGRGGHVLTFPIEHGKTMNVVAFATKEDGKWEHGQWVLPMRREDMEADFEGWVGAVRQILSLMEKPDLWALFDLPPAPTYYKRRMCVLGDSAHASTPHQGAGAGQAIEDALIVATVLGMAKGSEDIVRAFGVFDEVRKERSQKQVKKAREAGELYDLRMPGVEDDWDKVKECLSERQKWLWEYDIESEVRKAQRLMLDGSDG